MIQWDSKSYHKASAHGLAVEINEGQAYVTYLPGGSGRTAEEMDEMATLLAEAADKLRKDAPATTPTEPAREWAIGSKVTGAVEPPVGTYLRDKDGDFWYRRPVGDGWRFRHRALSDGFEINPDSEWTEVQRYGDFTVVTRAEAHRVVLA